MAPSARRRTLGERVEVEAKIADNPEALPVSSPGEEGCGKPPEPPKPPRTALEQTDVGIADGESATSTDIEAIVQGVCRASRKLIVSADDLRESGRDISITVPKALRIADLETGAGAEARRQDRRRGVAAVTTVASDEGKQGADDPDLRPARRGSER